MSRARIYTVHAPPAQWPRADDAVFVHEGFSWPAFCLSAIWALWNRMWLAAIVFVAGAAAIEIAVEALDIARSAELAGLLGWMIWIGFSANDWRRGKLAAAGYVVCGIVAAPDLLEAERRYFARHYERGLAVAP